MRKLFLLFSSALLAFSTAIAQDHGLEQPYIPETDQAVLKKLDEWQDWKFGMLIHWGAYSQWGIVESWSICPEDEGWTQRQPYGIPYYEYLKKYENLATTFNPTKFDPSKWAKAAKGAGMEYVVFTTKHHDGFCMWDTKQTDYGIAGSKSAFRNDPRKNVAKEVFTAFQKEGLHTGAYFSKPDWHSEYYWWSYFPPKDRHVNYDVTRYPDRWKNFKDYTYKQIEELMTTMGKIESLWLDGGWVRARTEEVLTRQADLTKAKAELDAATRNSEAVNRLQQKGAASQGEVVAAQQRLAKAQADVNLLNQKVGNRYSSAERSRTAADVEDARAALAAAEQMLADSNIRAPFSGTVYAVPVKQGAWVNAGDLLVQEADLSAMQVRTYVDEPEIGQLAPGQSVNVTWDAIPGRVWTGKVKSIPTTVVQHGTRTVGEVLCSVDNSDGKLIPNVNVNALITTNSHPGALIVPREALRDDGGKSVLFVVKDDHLVRTEVQTGVANLTQVEILKGISDHDVIATQSVSPTGMSDGIGVKIVDPTQ